MPKHNKNKSRSSRKPSLPKSVYQRALYTKPCLRSTVKVRYSCDTPNNETFNTATLLDQFNISTGALGVAQRRAFESVRLKSVTVFMPASNNAGLSTGSFMWGQSGGGSASTPGIMSAPPIDYAFQSTPNQPTARKFYPPRGSWQSGWFNSYTDGYTTSSNNFVICTFDIKGICFVEYELDVYMSATPASAGPASTNGISSGIVTQYEVCVGGCFNSAFAGIPVDWQLNKVL